MKFDGMGFYPEVLVIDVGDTVRWTGGSLQPHSVTFESGLTILPEGDLGDARPMMGGSTYDGTGFHSSGYLSAATRIH